MTEDSVVYVVDDDAAIRDSMQCICGAALLNCVSFASARAFVACRKNPVPSCLVLDVRLEDECGLDLLENYPDNGAGKGTGSGTGAGGIGMPVIVITASGDIPTAVRSMKLGVTDFIEKPADPQLLIRRIREALTADASRRSRDSDNINIRARLKNLTARERELLKLICNGLSNKQIAAQLQISIKTVANHRAHLLAKAKATNTADMVRIAVLGNAL